MGFKWLSKISNLESHASSWKIFRWQGSFLIWIWTRFPNFVKWQNLAFFCCLRLQQQIVSFEVYMTAGQFLTMSFIYREGHLVAGLVWFDTDSNLALFTPLPCCYANTAWFSSAWAECGWQWNIQKQSQPNPSLRQDAPSCTLTWIAWPRAWLSFKLGRRAVVLWHIFLAPSGKPFPSPPFLAPLVMPVCFLHWRLITLLCTDRGILDLSYELILPFWLTCLGG